MTQLSGPLMDARRWIERASLDSVLSRIPSLVALTAILIVISTALFSTVAHLTRHVTQKPVSCKPTVEYEALQTCSDKKDLSKEEETSNEQETETVELLESLRANLACLNDMNDASSSEYLAKSQKLLETEAHLSAQVSLVYRLKSEGASLAAHVAMLEAEVLALKDSRFECSISEADSIRAEELALLALDSASRLNGSRDALCGRGDVSDGLVQESLSADDEALPLAVSSKQANGGAQEEEEEEEEEMEEEEEEACLQETLESQRRATMDLVEAHTLAQAEIDELRYALLVSSNKLRHSCDVHASDKRHMEEQAQALLGKVRMLNEELKEKDVAMAMCSSTNADLLAMSSDMNLILAAMESSEQHLRSQVLVLEAKLKVSKQELTRLEDEVVAKDAFTQQMQAELATLSMRDAEASAMLVERAVMVASLELEVKNVRESLEAESLSSAEAKRCLCVLENEMSVVKAELFLANERTHLANQMQENARIASEEVAEQRLISLRSEVQQAEARVEAANATSEANAASEAILEARVLMLTSKLEEERQNWAEAYEHMIELEEKVAQQDSHIEQLAKASVEITMLKEEALCASQAYDMLKAEIARQAVAHRLASNAACVATEELASTVEGLHAERARLVMQAAVDAEEQARLCALCEEERRKAAISNALADSLQNELNSLGEVTERSECRGIEAAEALASLRREIDRLTSALTAAASSKHVADEEIAVLVEELSLARSSVCVHQGERAELETRVQELVVLAAVHAEESMKRSEEAHRNECELFSVREALEKSSMELLAKIAELEGTNADMHKRFEAKLLQLEQANSSIVELKETLKQATSEHEMEVMGLRTSLQEQIDKLTSGSASLDAQLCAKVIEFKSLQSYAGALQEQVRALHETNEMTSAENLKVIARLEAQVEVHRKETDHEEWVLGEELVELRRLSSSMEVERDGQSECTDVDWLVVEISELKAANAALETDMSEQAKAHQRALQTSIDERLIQVNALTEQIEGLLVEHKASKMAAVNAKEELAVATLRVSELEGRYERDTSTLRKGPSLSEKKTSEDAVALEDRLPRDGVTTEAMASLAMSVEQLTAENVSLKSDCDDALSALRLLAEEKLSLLDRVEAQKTQHEALLGKVTTLALRNDGVEAELRCARDELTHVSEMRNKEKSEMEAALRAVIDSHVLVASQHGYSAMLNILSDDSAEDTCLKVCVLAEALGGELMMLKQQRTINEDSHMSELRENVLSLEGELCVARQSEGSLMQELQDTTRALCETQAELSAYQTELRMGDNSFISEGSGDVLDSPVNGRVSPHTVNTLLTQQGGRRQHESCDSTVMSLLRSMGRGGEESTVTSISSSVRSTAYPIHQLATVIKPKTKMLVMCDMSATMANGDRLKAQRKCVYNIITSSVEVNASMSIGYWNNRLHFVVDEGEDVPYVGWRQGERILSGFKALDLAVPEGGQDMRTALENAIRSMPDATDIVVLCHSVAWPFEPLAVTTTSHMVTNWVAFRRRNKNIKFHFIALGPSADKKAFKQMARDGDGCFVVAGTS